MSLISKPEVDSAEERDLAAYVRAVADALGVPESDTGCEGGDVVCAYLYLTERADDHPARDLLLTWDETNGWQLALESRPGGSLHVVATLADGPKPDPATVAEFVTTTTAGHRGRPAARPRLN